MHSMLSLQDDGVTDNRSVWYQQNQDKPYQNGVLIFGGIDQDKQINNDLWLIEADAKHNKSEVFTAKGTYKYQSSSQQLYIKVQKVNAVGRPPMPRYGHAVCTFSKRYMVVHGGRNDSLIKETSHIILNDIHLYDYSKC